MTEYDKIVKEIIMRMISTVPGPRIGPKIFRTQNRNAGHSIDVLGKTEQIQ